MGKPCYRMFIEVNVISRHCEMNGEYPILLYGFLKWGYPSWTVQILENIGKSFFRMDDLGVTPFHEASIYNNIHYSCWSKPSEINGSNHWWHDVSGVNPPLLNDLFRDYTNQSIGWLSYFMDGVNQPVYADYLKTTFQRDRILEQANRTNIGFINFSFGKISHVFSERYN